MNTIKQKLILSLIAALTLGLSPHNDPHLIGKIKWVAGGANGMQIMDWFDLVLHGAPWLFLIYFGYQYFFSSSHKEMQNQLQQLVNDKRTNLIDVREVGEYKGGAAKGATNMPLSQFSSHINRIKQLEGPIVLYCRSGARSSRALSQLKSAGVTDVYNAGGLSDVLNMQQS